MLRKVQCPYCGNENKMVIDMSKQPDHEVIRCDLEESYGCDQKFFVEIDYYITLTPGAIDGRDVFHDTAEDNYEKRVQKLEDEGLTRSDAQGVVDAEDLQASRSKKNLGSDEIKKRDR